MLFAPKNRFEIRISQSILEAALLTLLSNYWHQQLGHSTLGLVSASSHSSTRATPTSKEAHLHYAVLRTSLLCSFLSQVKSALLYDSYVGKKQKLSITSS
jgi:hypothetical protein